MKISINGTTKIIKKEDNISTVTDILNNMGFNPDVVVVEYNEEILHPHNWQSQIIHDGDTFEIVTIVGGG